MVAWWRIFFIECACVSWRDVFEFWLFVCRGLCRCDWCVWNRADKGTLDHRRCLSMPLFKSKRPDSQRRVGWASRGAVYSGVCDDGQLTVISVRWLWLALLCLSPPTKTLSLTTDEGDSPSVGTRGGSRNLLCPLSSPLPFPLEVGSPLNQLGSLGERCKLPQRGPGGTPAENEFGSL